MCTKCAQTSLLIAPSRRRPYRATIGVEFNSLKTILLQLACPVMTLSIICRCEQRVSLHFSFPTSGMYPFTRTNTTNGVKTWFACNTSQSHVKSRYTTTSMCRNYARGGGVAHPGPPHKLKMLRFMPDNNHRRSSNSSYRQWSGYWFNCGIGRLDSKDKCLALFHVDVPYSLGASGGVTS